MNNTAKKHNLVNDSCQNCGFILPDMDKNCPSETSENAKRYKEVLRLLNQINDSWEESEVEAYPKNLPSFDELVAEMELIEFK